MHQPTLQGTIERKYNITEKMHVEGKFVALMGNSKNAICMVSIGIGNRCLIVAMVNLTGEEVDYDLISLSPLSLLSFSCHNQSKRLKVCSVFKSTQVYQLCSSIDQDEIWDRFTSTIRKLSLDKSDNIWLDQKLVCPSSNQQSTDIEDEYSSILNELYPYQAQMTRRIQAALKFKRDGHRPVLTWSSLPTIMDPTDVTGVTYKPPCRSRSEPCLDMMKFDSFINDVQTKSNRRQCKVVMCSSIGGSTDDLFRLDTVSLNRSNNFDDGHGTIDEEEEYYEEEVVEEAAPSDAKPNILQKLCRLCSSITSCYKCRS